MKLLLFKVRASLDLFNSAPPVTMGRKTIIELLVFFSLCAAFCLAQNAGGTGEGATGSTGKGTREQCKGERSGDKELEGELLVAQVREQENNVKGRGVVIRN